MKKLPLYLLCALWIMACGPDLMAQSEPESSTLVISGQRLTQQVKVKVGERLNYLPQGGRWQRGGRVEAVHDSSVTIASRDVEFAGLKAVQLHRRSLGTGTALLVGILLAEPILLLLYVAALLGGLDNPSSGARAVMLLLGIFVLFLLPALIIFAIVLLVLGSRRFAMARGWRLHKGR